ncbi:hypothetical protein I4632_16580, partial [Proteus mirabilis]|nr:hypothetical protein [Proteus mirabilis]
MNINKTKLKLLISTLLVIPSYNYANYNFKISELDPSAKKNIPFDFQSIEKDYIKTNPHTLHLNGSMEERTLPNILNSKSRNTIIISDDIYTDSNISYNSGNDFTPIRIKGISFIRFHSLSENGRYAFGSGTQNEQDIFFIYDTILEEMERISHKNINHHGYFSTQDGQYFLYSKGKDALFDINDSFIYSTHNKKNIPLNEIESNDIIKHKEINRFIAYKKTLLSKEREFENKNILGATFDGKYTYGILARKENHAPDYINIAFIYDPDNHILNKISTSKYGSSRINSVSKNNTFIGWYESMDPQKNRLFRRAYFYTPSDNRITDIKPLHNPLSPQDFEVNSEATGISDDGNSIVGWSEYERKRPSYNKNIANSYYLRQAFIYFKNDNKTYPLQHLAQGDESEALSITSDGNIIYGVADDQNNKWKSVAWKVSTRNKDSLEKRIEEKYRENIKEIYSSNDILLIENIIKKSKETIDLLNNNLSSSISNLEKQKKEREKNIQEIISKIQENQRKIDLIETSYEDHVILNDQNEQYEEDKKNHLKALSDINIQLSSLNNSEDFLNLTNLNEIHHEAQNRLIELKNAHTKEKQAEKAKAEQDRLAKEQADKIQVDKDRLAKEQADKIQADKDRLAKEQADKIQVDKDRLAKEQAD